MNYKTFAINVKKNEYRRQYILGQQEKAGLKIRIFDAITPDKISNFDLEYCPIRAQNFYGRPLLEAEIACALSHMSLWQSLLKDDVDAYLIMEDDITIQDNLSCLIERIDDCTLDFLKFSGQCKRPSRKITLLKDRYHLYKYAYGPLDAACYLITKQAVRNMLPYCQNLFAPIDIMMDRSYDHGIDVYGVMPCPTETAFCFDVNSPLYTDVGVRDDSYKQDRTLWSRLCVRVQRVYGSLKRKKAVWDLWREEQKA